MKSQSLQIGATIFQEEVYSLWASERRREACPTRLCDFATNSSARNLPKNKNEFDEDTPNSEFQAFPVHLGHFPWL